MPGRHMAGPPGESFQTSIISKLGEEIFDVVEFAVVLGQFRLPSCYRRVDWSVKMAWTTGEG